MSGLCYRLLKWQPYTIRRNYDKDGIHVRCPYCHAKEFTSQVIDTIDYTVCEEEYLCRGCGRRVGYWAYGYFDPCFRFGDRSWPALYDRTVRRLRRIEGP